jgi:ferric iron reductase protein FhuF
VVLGAELPAPRRDQVWWRAVDGGPLPVAVAGIGVVATVDADDDAVAAAFGEIVVDGLIGPLLAAFRRRFRLSPKVLHGNVASALGGAVTMLAGAGPTRVGRARRIVERLLARAPLAGEATIVRPQWRLRRANCCLYYRIPGGGYCGDCVLHPVNR